MSTASATKTKTSKISSKRQITLPKQFLDYLDLDLGQMISITIKPGKIEISNPKNSVSQKLEKLVGSISPKIKTNLTIEEQIEASKKTHFKNKSL
ncbi:MAG: AbrB/MazE/SpoVT family DNA-binding domain-containing protein [bacterium]